MLKTLSLLVLMVFAIKVLDTNLKSRNESLLSKNHRLVKQFKNDGHRQNGALKNKNISAFSKRLQTIYKNRPATSSPASHPPASAKQHRKILMAQREYENRLKTMRWHREKSKADKQFHSVPKSKLPQPEFEIAKTADI